VRNLKEKTIEKIQVVLAVCGFGSYLYSIVTANLLVAGAVLGIVAVLMVWLEEIKWRNSKYREVER